MYPGGACEGPLCTAAVGPTPDPVLDGTTTDAVVSVAGADADGALTLTGVDVPPCGGKGSVTIPDVWGGPIDTWTFVPVIFLTTFE